MFLFVSLSVLVATFLLSCCINTTQYERGRQPGSQPQIWWRSHRRQHLCTAIFLIIFYIIYCCVPYRIHISIRIAFIHVLAVLELCGWLCCCCCYWCRCWFSFSLFLILRICCCCFLVWNACRFSLAQRANKLRENNVPAQLNENHVQFGVYCIIVRERLRGCAAQQLVCITKNDIIKYSICGDTRTSAAHCQMSIESAQCVCSWRELYCFHELRPITMQRFHQYGSLSN